jgi:hypothetical protein
VFRVFNGVVDDLKSVLESAIVAMAIWFVAWTWFRTKALVPTLSSLLLGAIVIYGVQNFDTTLKDRVKEDVDHYSNDPGNPRGGG